MIQEDISEIFYQGDYRYDDPWKEPIVREFIKEKAINIEQEIIKLSPWNCSDKGIKGPQKELKSIGRKLLKDRGYSVVGFEVRIKGGIADILGKKDEEIKAVECGPCRIDKAIEYLKNPHTNLWILRKHDEATYILYKIGRGENWDRILKSHMERTLKENREAVRKAFESV